MCEVLPHLGPITLGKNVENGAANQLPVFVSKHRVVGVVPEPDNAIEVHLLDPVRSRLEQLSEPLSALSCLVFRVDDSSPSQFEF